MSSGHNYPDNLYADQLAAIRVHTGRPTGAYQAAPEMSASERKLRTALAYVNHARDLISQALELEAKAVPEPERVPKWDPKWASEQQQVREHVPLESVYVANPHPMAAEYLREFERDDNASGV